MVEENRLNHLFSFSVNSLLNNESICDVTSCSLTRTNNFHHISSFEPVISRYRITFLHTWKLYVKTTWKLLFLHPHPCLDKINDRWRLLVFWILFSFYLLIGRFPILWWEIMRKYDPFIANLVWHLHISIEFCSLYNYFQPTSAKIHAPFYWKGPSFSAFMNGDKLYVQKHRTWNTNLCLFHCVTL